MLTAPPDSPPLWRILVDELFPVDCVLCGARAFALCPTCEREMGDAASASASFVPGTRVPLVSATAQHREARTVMSRFKDHLQTELAGPLARLILSALARALPLVPPRSPLVVTTIPATWAARRKRGFTPMRLVLRRAGVAHASTLTSRGVRQDQRALDAVARARNVHGTMRARADVAGCSVILVDDVVTTGATVAEAIRALTAAGAHVVAVVCLCVVPKVFPETRESRDRRTIQA